MIDVVSRVQSDQSLSKARRDGVKGGQRPSDGSMNTGRRQIQLDHLFSEHPNEKYNCPLFTLAQPTTSRAEAMRLIRYGSHSL